MIQIADLSKSMRSPDFHAFDPICDTAEEKEIRIARYEEIIAVFCEKYGADRQVSLFSVPGRSELSGNHTDHNHGCVIACSVSLDTIAVAAPRDDSLIRITSLGFGDMTVDFKTFTSPDGQLFGTSDALVAGVVRGFSDAGYHVGGFDAVVSSTVEKGSGLSSSAAFEDMVGLILSTFCNGGTVGAVEIAKISQFSENRFFGKPCGLMDQIACANGGVVFIDFEDPAKPQITSLPLDFTSLGYRLCIVNTGGNHADLTADYAAVPYEMKQIASAFGKSTLREVSEADFLAVIPTLRERFGDRPVLRAIHFFEENKRVCRQRDALFDVLSADGAGERQKAFARFLGLVNESGKSSFCYLQNVYATVNPSEQGVSLALALSDLALSGQAASFRVHGGGFAGTVQAILPEQLADGFRQTTEAVFGIGSCMILSVRKVGAVCLI